MTGRAFRWGAVGAAALVAFYVAVLAASGGWAHLVDQARTDWWLLAPIVLAFGAQVALTVELRHRHRTHHLAATTGASAVGMVARSAHHLADLVPLLGAAGVAGFLFDWRIPFMAGGLDLDVAANTELTVDGTDWVYPACDGAGPGGHHREGAIRFTAGGPSSGDMVLTIGGLDEPVTATWTLSAGG